MSFLSSIIEFSSRLFHRVHLFSRISTGRWRWYRSCPREATFRIHWDPCSPQVVALTSLYCIRWWAQQTIRWVLSHGRLLRVYRNCLLMLPIIAGFCFDRGIKGSSPRRVRNLNQVDLVWGDSLLFEAPMPSTYLRGRANTSLLTKLRLNIVTRNSLVILAHFSDDLTCLHVARFGQADCQSLQVHPFKRFLRWDRLCPWLVGI